MSEGEAWREFDSLVNAATSAMEAASRTLARLPESARIDGAIGGATLSMGARLRQLQASVDSRLAGTKVGRLDVPGPLGPLVERDRLRTGVVGSVPAFARMTSTGSRWQ